MNLPHLQYNFTKQIALVVTKKRYAFPEFPLFAISIKFSRNHFSKQIYIYRYPIFRRCGFKDTFHIHDDLPQLNSISIAWRKKEEGNRRKVSFLPGLVFPLCSWSAPRGMFLKLVRIGVMHGAGSF